MLPKTGEFRKAKFNGAVSAPQPTPAKFMYVAAPTAPIHSIQERVDRRGMFILSVRSSRRIVPSPGFPPIFGYPKLGPVIEDLLFRRIPVQALTAPIGLRRHNTNQSVRETVVDGRVRLGSRLH